MNVSTSISVNPMLNRVQLFLRRPFSWVLVAAVVAAGIVGLKMWKQPAHEATYQGRRIEFWFREYYMRYQSHGSRLEAEEPAQALRALRPDAVPYLTGIALDVHADSLLKKFYLGLYNGGPRWWKEIAGRPLSSEERSQTAAYALRDVIKPSAAELLPWVTSVLKSPNVMARRQAVFLLGTVGDGAEQAAPYLGKALDDPDRWLRQMAAQSLNWIGPKAKPALPQILVALQTDGPSFNLVRTLENLGPDAQTAVPLLNKYLSAATNAINRVAVAAALYRIDPQQTNAYAVLVEALNARRDPQLRQSAAEAWARAGLPRETAVKALQDLLRGPSWHGALAGLRRIGAEDRSAIPILLDKFKDGHDAKSFAAACILLIDPHQTNALAVLVDAARSDPLSGFRVFAIVALGGAGPAARSAIPALKQALNDRDAEVRDAAVRALKRIETEPVAK